MKISDRIKESMPQGTTHVIVNFVKEKDYYMQIIPAKYVDGDLFLHVCQSPMREWPAWRLANTVFLLTPRVYEL